MDFTSFSHFKQNNKINRKRKRTTAALGPAGQGRLAQRRSPGRGRHKADLGGAGTRAGTSGPGAASVAQRGAESERPSTGPQRVARACAYVFAK